MADFDWNDAAVAQLRELWDQDLSTAEIGRRLGVSKNALVGKAHRLDLPSRPSPIRRDPAAAAKPAAPVVRAGASTLPPLASAIAAAPVPSIPPGLVVRPAPPAKAAPAPPPAPPKTPRRPAASCCWPIGEPGRKDFRFCDDAALPGKPYCGEHADIAFVSITGLRRPGERPPVLPMSVARIGSPGDRQKYG